MNRSCVPSGARWMHNGVLFELSLPPSCKPDRTGGHGEVHLVRGDGEFPADGAPHLHVDFRPVKRRLVRDLDVVDAGFDQHLALGGNVVQLGQNFSDSTRVKISHELGSNLSWNANVRFRSLNLNFVLSP